jgi:hypothetical protein
MIRPVIAFLGGLAALLPDRMIDIFETVAIENPDECAIKPWIDAGIRTEGVLVIAASLIGGRAYAWMMNLTGAFGAVVVVSPQLYRRFATTLLYENPDSVEWNDRATTGVRIIEVVYVLLALKALTKRLAAE